MTPKQRRFVEEYLVDLNATQAAIRAGYAKSGAEVTGHRLLRNDKIALAVSAAQGERSDRTEITQDMVLRELAKIGFSDIRKMFTPGGNLLPVGDLEEEAAACLSSVEVVTRKVPGGEGDEVEHVAKIKLWDKQAALVNIGRHLGMFKDKIEHTGKDGGPIEVEQQVRSDAEAFLRSIDGLAERAADKPN